MGQWRVLIIDDDPAIVRLLQEILEPAGYAVTAADSALGAAALVRRLRPHVILLDLGLPYRSGAALLAELKADRGTADVPILVVSGLAETLPAHRRALAADVISKPFSPRELLDAVRAARRPRGAA